MALLYQRFCYSENILFTGFLLQCLKPTEGYMCVADNITICYKDLFILQLYDHYVTVLAFVSMCVVLCVTVTKPPFSCVINSGINSHVLRTLLLFPSWDLELSFTVLHFLNLFIVALNQVCHNMLTIFHCLNIYG